MSFEQDYQEVIQLLTQRCKPDSHTKKPLLPHLLRVGKRLYKAQASRDAVTAGLLHDALEWTDISAEEIQQRFGTDVLTIVQATTKDPSISDAMARRVDYVTRCAHVGLEALQVKAADVLDSYVYYQHQGNASELKRCHHIAQLCLAHWGEEEGPLKQELRRMD